MGNESRRSLFVLLHLLIRFCVFLVLLFNIVDDVSFGTTILDKIHFQSQLHLSENNVKVPIHLKLKIYAVIIERGSRICFFFVGRQDIVINWDFPF